MRFASASRRNTREWESECKRHLDFSDSANSKVAKDQFETLIREHETKQSKLKASIHKCMEDLHVRGA